MNQNKGFRPVTFLQFFCIVAACWVMLLGENSLLAASPKKVVKKMPNVVLVITDDQGYGDLGCNGNKVILTPHLDQLSKESVRLTNFHVDPTCAPTRSALMSGRYSSKTGVWHTIMGRSLMRTDEVTIAELFQSAGYRTGIFGKWHLGDNFPCRPQDQGFQDVFIHGGGGVGQTPDYWGNDYFDDTYNKNNKFKKQTGYCTDIWFDGAMKFIEKNQSRPFFCYLSTNAPHSPYNVSKKYSDIYKKKGVPSPRAEFWGMITNIDENMARLRRHLKKLKLEENTVFIFMSDNGSAAGMKGKGGYNAGMRGIKGSEYDGGHRVPCFIKYPNGGIGGGRDISQLTAHIDLLPTLAELCGLKAPQQNKIDGVSIVPLLKFPERVRWASRTLTVHSQRIEHPEKWRKSAVMTDQWRLVNGTQLFDIQKDPGQKKEIAVKHPAVVKQLRQEYEKWYKDISVRFDDYVQIELGSPKENPAHLTAHDWHAHIRQIPWNQTLIQKDLQGNGFWAVNVSRAGTYKITLRSRPKEVNHPLDATDARLTIGKVDVSQQVKKGATSTTFLLKLPRGNAMLQTWLTSKSGKKRGAYYAEVEFVKK